MIACVECDTCSGVFVLNEIGIQFAIERGPPLCPDGCSTRTVQVWYSKGYVDDGIDEAKC